MRYLVVLLLAACATQPEYVWERYGASDQDFSMDAGQCRAQAFGAPGMPAMQVALIYSSCMQGRGWSRVPKQ